MLYIAGAVLAVLLNWLGVPALAFCLGMFIPMQLNAPACRRRDSMVCKHTFG